MEFHSDYNALLDIVSDIKSDFFIIFKFIRISTSVNLVDINKRTENGIRLTIIG